MSGRISEDDRQAYARLVDILLPEAHGMPAGNAVGVADEGLDWVVKLRPDLVPEWLRGLRLFANGGTIAALEADAPAWHAIRVVAFGAYYNSPQLRAILNYSGQQAHPFDPDEPLSSLRDGLLQPVIDRGAIWTRAPQ